MKWRDRLALWCLRVLAPTGLGELGVPLKMSFDSGLSTPEDPKLVMRLDTLAGQRIVSLVFDPDLVVDQMSWAVDALREWAATS